MFNVKNGRLQSNIVNISDLGNVKGLNRFAYL